MRKKESTPVKEKRRIRASSARRFVASEYPLEARAVYWVEQWIENYLRNNSLPLQFCSDDFDNQIMSFLPPLNADYVIKKLRTDFNALFPHQDPPLEDMSFLESISE